MIEAISQKCEKCGWVITSSLGKTQVKCQKCGYLNNIKGFQLKVKDLKKAFYKDNKQY